VVRFLPSGYSPPLRVSQDLTDRQRRVLQILADGNKRRLQEIHGSLDRPPAKRTLLDDLRLLRRVGLVDSGGRGAGAKWWLVQPNDVE
jgi:ATP-dependent DNA helicase RecG